MATTDSIKKTELALLLADALLTEAREREDAAWSHRGSGDCEPATEATRRRMRAEFNHSRARRAHEQEVRMSEVQSLRNERIAVERARDEAHGAQKGVLTRKLRELDARIAEFETGDGPPPRREFTSGTADTIDEAVKDFEQRNPSETPKDATRRVDSLEQAVEPEPQPRARKPKDPTPVDPPEGTTPRVAAILRAGVPVTKVELVDAVIADAAGQPDADLTAMGDIVVSNGLLRSYSRAWVGRWLGAGPEKIARKRLAETAAV
jgi:hypothetical protein